MGTKYLIETLNIFKEFLGSRKKVNSSINISLLFLYFSLPFYKIIVPTVDTVRYEYLVSKLLQEEHPVMLVGNVGTGKTSTAVSVMDSCDKTKYTVLSINISAQVKENNFVINYKQQLISTFKLYFVDDSRWFAGIN